MKHYPILLSILAVCGAIAARADDVIPKRPDFSRYLAMVDRSPFAVASAPAPTATAPPWSKDLFIANAAHTQEADLVTVMSLSDKNMKEYVSTEGPNKNGYSVANIEWSDAPGGTKVTISKDGQLATIGFNEAFMAQRPSSPPPAMPNFPPPQGVKPPVQPAVQPGTVVVPPAMPAPHTRGVIQRKPPPQQAAPLMEVKPAPETKPGPETKGEPPDS